MSIKEEGFCSGCHHLVKADHGPDDGGIARGHTVSVHAEDESCLAGECVNCPVAQSCGPVLEPREWSATDLIEAAADLISRPGCWCQETLGRNAEGHAVPVAQATCFCPLGAVLVLGRGTPAYGLAIDALVRHFDERYGFSVTWANDQPGATAAMMVEKMQACARGMRERVGELP